MTIKTDTASSQDAPLVPASLPSTSYYGTTQAQEQPQTVLIDEATPVTTTELDPLTTAVVVVAKQQQQQDLSPACRDLFFAILFYAQFAVMIWLGVDVAPAGFKKIDINFTAIEEEIRQSDDMTADEEFKEFVTEVAKFVQVYPERILYYLVLPCVVVAFVIALVVTAYFIKPCPRTIVRVCLVESFVWMALIMISASVASNSIALWAITAISLAAVLYYISIAWKMVPFAAVNLKVALEGIGRNCGMYIVAFLFSLLGIVYVIYWFYVVVGVFSYQNAKCQQEHPEANFDMSSDDYDETCEPPLSVVLLFLLSLYWTCTVTMNMIQVTVAGVMATWCYAKDEANHCCSSAVLSSLFRSLTYSFGSVCLGSLLQALISLLRRMLEQARNERDRNGGCEGCGSLILCILECIAGLLEDLIYVFNQYAFIYAGIYGFSYVESGRKVMDLFRARGWTTIITNNLVGYVLSCTAFTVAAATGGVAVLVEAQVTRHLGTPDFEYNSYLLGPVPGWRYWTFAIGFIIGLWVCSIMMNVVKGAVNTLIVCWADSPTVFEMNHPAITKEMADSWVRVFPEINFNVRPAGAITV